MLLNTRTHTPLLALALVLGMSSASAQPVTYVCTYHPGSTAGTTLRRDEPPMELTFVVDRTTRTGHVVGNAGSASVTVVPHQDGGITLLETTETGTVQVTAITPDGASVHSRHTIIAGQLTPSQVTGTCIVR